MPASGLGKFKMASQVVAILLLILGWERVPALLVLGQAALWVVLLTAVVSAVDYYQGFQQRDGRAAPRKWPTSKRRSRPGTRKESQLVLRAGRRGTAISVVLTASTVVINNTFADVADGSVTIASPMCTSGLPSLRSR